MNSEELLRDSSTTAAALAVGEGWERGLDKGIIAESGSYE